MSRKRDPGPEELDFSGLEDVLEKPRHGGKRQGAGRKEGSKNALPAGTVKAIKAARLRVPDDASPEAGELAGRALERIIDVMEDRVGFGGFAVLSAARAIREEVCGPVKQKVEHTGADGGPLTIKVVTEAEEEGIVIEAADA